MQYDLPRASDRLVWDLWMSSYWVPTITAAAECGLFDLLDEQEATRAELAEQLALNPRATGIVVSMLAALGLLVVRAGKLRLTDVGREYVVQASAFCMLPAVRIGLDRAKHDRLLALLRDDRAVDDAARAGMPAEDWARGDIAAERAATVAIAMHAHSLPAAVTLARTGLLAGVRRLLDVGGGSGCYSIALAQHDREVEATILDLPAMCECARRYIADGRVEDRVTVMAADMLRTPWPTGYDAILLANVLHDWSFDTCADIVARACAALPAGGRIFVHEMLLDDDCAGPAATAAFSLMMLFGTRGQQFTASELHELLSGAGFRDVVVSSARGYFSLVAARKS